MNNDETINEKGAENAEDTDMKDSEIAAGAMGADDAARDENTDDEYGDDAV